MELSSDFTQTYPAPKSRLFKKQMPKMANENTNENTNKNTSDDGTPACSTNNWQVVAYANSQNPDSRNGGGGQAGSAESDTNTNSTMSVIVANTSGGGMVEEHAERTTPAVSLLQCLDRLLALLREQAEITRAFIRDQERRLQEQRDSLGSPPIFIPFDRTIFEKLKFEPLFPRKSPNQENPIPRQTSQTGQSFSNTNAPSEDYTTVRTAIVSIIILPVHPHNRGGLFDN